MDFNHRDAMNCAPKFFKTHRVLKVHVELLQEIDALMLVRAC